MPHECGPACEYRLDLNAAAAALEESSRRLIVFALGEPVDLIENYYAYVRASEIKLRGAMAAFRDHLTES